MSGQNLTLEDYIHDVLDEKDLTLNYLFQQYKDEFPPMINKLDTLSPERLANSLEFVADELFSTNTNHVPYITSFLLFNIELNRFCATKYDWYSKTTLVQILVQILNKKYFDLNKRRCVILYHLVLILPLINGQINEVRNK